MGCQGLAPKPGTAEGRTLCKWPCHKGCAHIRSMHRRNVQSATCKAQRAQRTVHSCAQFTGQRTKRSEHSAQRTCSGAPRQRSRPHPQCRFRRGGSECRWQKRGGEGRWQKRGGEGRPQRTGRRLAIHQESASGSVTAGRTPARARNSADRASPPACSAAVAAQQPQVDWAARISERALLGCDCAVLHTAGTSISYQTYKISV